MPESPDVQAEVRSRLHRDDEFSQEDIEECEVLLDAHYEKISFPDAEVRLDAIEAENFKILEEEAISFDGQSSVLHGLNSTGKTSLLTAIQFNLLGIPGSSDERSQYGMTELIHEDAQTLRTDGTWRVGDTSYLIQRFLELQGRGGAYARYEEPRVTETPVDEGFRYDRRDTQSDVSELAGFHPLERRGFNRFGIASLFFVMSKDFRLFMDWHRQSDMIDLLFG
jgi:DNA sulfur modification protein DndD